jgi:hypothetical protein
MSLKKSFTVDAQIIVVLNEGDKESAGFLCDENIPFIKLDQNFGTLAVDYAAHLIQSEYYVNANDDMLFHRGWDSDLIQIIEENYPASASCARVEPVSVGEYGVLIDDLGAFEEAYEPFIRNYTRGKYKIAPYISHYHPIMVKTQDYFKVGGYSDKFDWNWFPGYALDDYFAWRLWKLHDCKYKPITSGNSFVYHGLSRTMIRLPDEIRRRDVWSYFLKKTGMTTEEFKARLGGYQRSNSVIQAPQL